MFSGKARAGENVQIKAAALLITEGALVELSAADARAVADAAVAHLTERGLPSWIMGRVGPVDPDASRHGSDWVQGAKGVSGGGVLMITHYKRILNYVKPDFIHVFADGKIVQTGDASLADQLEAEGYEKFI